MKHKNDWILQLNIDLNLCNITISEEKIKNMKKETFKSLLKSKINLLAKEYLIKLRSSHSKSVNLMHANSMKEYLKTDLISVDEKKLLFSMKTRTVNVKTNFKSNFSNLLCRLCFKPNEEESELHLMSCQKLNNEIDINSIFRNIAYIDIFGTLDKQIFAIKIWKKFSRSGIWNWNVQNCPLVDTKLTSLSWVRVTHVLLLLL